MPTERIGDTVVKTYSEELRWQWGREVAFLRRLQGIPNFPKIVDIGDHSITTTWRGEPIGTSFRAIPQRLLARELESILVVLRDAQIVHRDITVHNLLWDVRSELITLIDFGWSVWNWEPESPMPVPDVMKPTMYRTDREQVNALLVQIQEMRDDV